MKSVKNKWGIHFLFRMWVAVAVLTVTVSSCLEDDEYEVDELLFAIGNVRIIEGNDYYFELDEGSKLYPGDTTAISNYPLVENQRAFVYFTLLEQALPGYEYNAALKHVENILTKDIHKMTPEEEDSIGHDRIDVDNIWLTEDYVNIVYRFYHSNNAEKKHMLNLVVNENDSASDDGFLHLEFRHNAYNDTPLQGGNGIVSFRLDSIRDQLDKYEGLCIRAYTLYQGENDFFVKK